LATWYFALATKQKGRRKVMKGGLFFLTLYFLLFPEIPTFAQSGIWTSAIELARLPKSGAAWEAVLNGANQDCSNPRVWDKDDNTNVYVLAAGIVYARTGDEIYKNKVITACETLMVGRNPGGRTLAWAREAGAYALAADLVGYRSEAFATWLRNMAEVYIASNNITLLTTFKNRANNWGAHAFGSLCAIYYYLGDSTRINEIRNYWIAGVLGSNTGYVYGNDWSWHFDENNLRLINPKGAIKFSFNIDGIIADDMRRGGFFQTPPIQTAYPWEYMQGLVMAARILERADLPIWSVGDSAIYRAAYALQVRLEPDSGWAAIGDDTWMLPFLDKAYGTKWSGTQERLWEHGKNVGWGYVILEPPRPPPYTLKVNVTGSGKVQLDPAGGTYNDSAIVKLTAIADSNWVFDHWRGDVIGSSNPATIVIDTNKTVTATFVNRIGATITLYPTDDCYVRAGSFALRNHNAEAKLTIKKARHDSADYHAYLKFDLSGVRGALISAKLKLYCEALPDSSPAAASAFAVFDDRWQETSITWNNAPALGVLLDSLAEINQAGAAYVFDVTKFVAAEFSSDKMVTLLIKDMHNTNKAVDFGSREGANPPALIITTGIKTAVTDVAPQTWQLHQNYPNPFERVTKISYSLSTPALVKLTIYDIKGRTVSTLVNAVQAAGIYSHIWNLSDSGKHRLPAGIYFCRMQVGPLLKTIKMVLMQ